MRAHGTEYWDSLARRFDQRVCHVLAEDRGGVVARALAAEARRLRSPRKGRAILAGDFGCGTGRAIPLLLRSFGNVFAVDTSAECLVVARAACRSPRVRFAQANLGAVRPSLPVVDVGLCINVAIMPGERTRGRLLANVMRHVRPGGRLLLVVPSLESELCVRRRWHEWKGAPLRVRPSERPVAGLFEVGGALTKTWTREELLLVAPKLGCRAISIERVEYAWSTEFVRPPRGMGEPYPWDWLVTLERRPRRGPGSDEPGAQDQCPNDHRLLPLPSARGPDLALPADQGGTAGDASRAAR